MTQIGRYEIVEEVGRGGFATVFRARDSELDRLVALKVLHAGWSSDPDFVRRFRQEAKTVANLRHPNIVVIHDVGEIDRQLFISMEYLPGENLRSWLARRDGPLSVAEAMPILRPIAAALDYAHEQGVIHRDVKPGNVMIQEKDKDYRVVLTDFGLVKAMESSVVLTTSGEILGSPEYMAPEQADPNRRDDVGPHSDLYAFGILAYRMLAGRVPFPGRSISTLHAQVNLPVPSPLEFNKALSDETVSILFKMLAKEPAGRFPSGAAFIKSLETMVQKARYAEEREEQVSPLYAKLQQARANSDWVEVVSLAAQIEMVAPDYRDVAELKAEARQQLKQSNAPEPAASETSVARPPEEPVTEPERQASRPQKQPLAPATEPGRPGEDSAARGTRTVPMFVWGIAGVLIVGVLGLGLILLVSSLGGDETAGPVREDTFLDRALAGEFAGTTVGIMSTLVEADEALFLEAMKAFEESTGIAIEHVSSKEFEAEITGLVEAGQAPDIAMFSQPGLLANFVANGQVADVRNYIPEADLQKRYARSWLVGATMPGPEGEPVMAGVWYKVLNKDLVWYPKDRFEAAGYEVPATWDELIALSDRIVADGGTPWCIGMESGYSSGWVATDWIESLMLRTTAPEDYDAWVAGELPFSSDQVENAARLMSDVWFHPDYVLGGREQIVNESFADSPIHMFEEPPGCWMHKQGSFIQGFFPQHLEAGVSWDVFYFPPVDPQFGEPVLMAGDLFAMLNDRPEARALMEYLSTAASVEVIVRKGGGLSPHRDSDLDWYETDVDRHIAEITLRAETVRFDASDLMPAEVGTRTFFLSMVEYVGGAVDLNTALRNIDESWPR